MTTPLQAAVERAKAIYFGLDQIRRDEILHAAADTTSSFEGDEYVAYVTLGLLSAQQDVDETWNAAVRACAEQIGGPPEDPGEFENWSTNDGDVDDHARLSARWHARERVLSLLRPTPHHASPHE